MHRSVMIAAALLIAASGCDTSVLGPNRFRQPDKATDPQPTQLLDGRWRAIKWTVTNPYGESVDVLALGGRIELSVNGSQSSGELFIPDGVPGFWPAQSDLNGVALALGPTATFQLVNPSFVSRATWSFGERHLTITRYRESFVETTVMLQRE